MKKDQRSLKTSERWAVTDCVVEVGGFPASSLLLFSTTHFFFPCRHIARKSGCFTSPVSQAWRPFLAAPRYCTLFFSFLFSFRFRAHANNRQLQPLRRLTVTLQHLLHGHLELA